MKILPIAALTALLLAACSPDPDMRLESQPAAQSSPRVSVTRIGIFSDQLAYNERRGIYVIRDAQTGKEFIGVSGIGITEVGSHSSGKHSVQDDR